ncbi:MAG: molybdopterin molybdotransferase MoeA [Candidatus Thermoplasmatota archaeon]|nr:molybdopterin molybdotransferase MoeA [Candidatus Thermoplasmatota archaeon]
MTSGKNISIVEARETLRLGITLPVEWEMVPVMSSMSRINATDVHAQHDSPEWPRSAMDGYAVRHADIAQTGHGDTVSLHVSGEVVLGEGIRSYSGNGICVRVPTGGHIPEPFDTVIPVEYTSENSGNVIIKNHFPEGSNVDVPGSYHRAGSLLVRSGKIISSSDIAVLSSEGLARIKVVRKVRTGILATGNELVEPGSSEKGWKTFNSNSYAVGALLQEAGSFSVTDYGIARDETSGISGSLGHMVSENTVVVTTGGSSAGTRDLVEGAISRILKGASGFHGIRMKPGAPTMFMTDGRHFVLGLPGTPVSSYIVMRELFLPVMMEKLGAVQTDMTWRMELAQETMVTPGKFNVVPVRVDWGKNPIRAFPVQGSSSSVARLSGSTGYFTCEGDDRAVPEGTMISVKPLKWVSP